MAANAPHTLIAFVITCFFLAVSWKNKMVLASPVRRAELLNKISGETHLPFPASARVVEYLEPENIDPKWKAKIIIPDASYKELREAISKEANEPSNMPSADTTSWWWKPVSIDIKRQFFAGPVDFVVLVAAKENGEWVIYGEHTFY